MFIKRYGSGPRVFVGLHGWSGNHRTFAPLAPYVPDGVTLYAPDLPGYGKTPPPRQWTLENVTEAIVQGLQQVDTPVFTLIGNCSGAILGLLAAQCLIDRIPRLVLIDPFAYIPWYFRVFLSGRWGRYTYMSTFANPVGRWLTNTALRHHRTERTDLTDSFAVIDHTVTYGYLKMFATLEGIDRFGVFTIPIDIAYGERTFGAIRRSLPRWRHIWPHARCWEMKGAGHLPIMEATEQVARIAFHA